jgi:hypothetical protein
LEDLEYSDLPNFERVLSSNPHVRISDRANQLMRNLPRGERTNFVPLMVDHTDKGNTLKTVKSVVFTDEVHCEFVTTLNNNTDFAF